MKVLEEGEEEDHIPTHNCNPTIEARKGKIFGGRNRKPYSISLSLCAKDFIVLPSKQDKEWNGKNKL
jgi:hypothetical protein